MGKTLTPERIAFYIAMFLLTAFIIAALLPATGGSGTSVTLRRMANLRSATTGLMNYADEHQGVYPAQDEFKFYLMWLTDEFPEPIFGPDETQDNIWIVPIPWPDRRVPEDLTQEELAQIPLLHERVDLNPDGTSVAFWDGHVEFLTNEEFEAIVDVEQSVCLACEFGTNNWLKKRDP